MEIKLSIFIPVYNEAAYLEQCIASLQSNHSAAFEVILSDNHSNDGTYENLQSINDSRFKIVRPPRKLSPLKHHWFAFNHCKGEYVFFIGGDDYFEDGIIDRIIPNLQNNKIIFGLMRCFNDKDGTTMSICNDREFLIEKIFFKNNFIHNYLNQISHDEILYAFVPKKLLKNGHRIFGNCLETFLPWIGFLVFTHKSVIKEIVYLDETIFHKRYNRTYDNVGSFMKDQTTGIWASSYTVKSIKSFINCFIFFFQNYDIKSFLLLLFRNRSMERPKTHKGGFLQWGEYGQRNWYLGPVFMVILSPFIDVFKLYKLLINNLYS